MKVPTKAAAYWTTQYIIPKTIEILFYFLIMHARVSAGFKYPHPNVPLKTSAKNIPV
jgi:hypothetical protein